MIRVVPAIIPASFDNLNYKLSRVKDHVDLVQVDVLDGKFVPSVSWPYDPEHQEQYTAIAAGKVAFPYAREVSFEVDMMVRQPEQYIDDWIKAGARSCIIHIESTNKLGRIIKHLHAHTVGIGIALKPKTKNERLEPFLSHVDFVQCMGNDKIGYQGVSLQKSVLGKIKDLRKARPELIIGVDIGVNIETAPELIAAGANKLVSGSAIFSSDNIPQAIEALTQ